MQQPREQHVARRHLAEVHGQRAAALEGDPIAGTVGLHGKIDRGAVGIDAEVALKGTEVTQRVPGAAADVQDCRLAVGRNAPVERAHVDPADHQRADVVVDEGIAQETLVQAHAEITRESAYTPRRAGYMTRPWGVPRSLSLSPSSTSRKSYPH